MENVTFQKIKEDEALFLKEFCSSDKKALGYPFEDMLLSFIRNGAWWCIIDGKKAGCISYSYKKRLKEIRVENLYVVPDFRHKGIALKLLLFLYEQKIGNNCISNSNSLNYVAECWDGFPNNSFYDKISMRFDLVKRKCFCDLRRYFLDIKKIISILSEK